MFPMLFSYDQLRPAERRRSNPSRGRRWRCPFPDRTSPPARAPSTRRQSRPPATNSLSACAVSPLFPYCRTSTHSEVELHLEADEPPAENGRRIAERRSVGRDLGEHGVAIQRIED